MVEDGSGMIKSIKLIVQIKRCEMCAHRQCKCSSFLGCEGGDTTCFDNEYRSKELEYGNPGTTQKYSVCKELPACPTGC